jgi:CHAT domain-containing protein
MRFRSPIIPIVTLLLTTAAMPAPARGDDPDMKDLMGALDEASSSVDIAWLQTLVDHGQYDAAIAAQKSALASAGRLSGEKSIAAISRIHAWVARAFLAKGELELAADSYRRALETMKSSESTRRELEVDAQVGLGWIYLCKGDIDTSLEHFNNAHLTLEKQGRANSAGRVPLLLGTARAYLARGDRAKAQSVVDQAQTLGGTTMEANTLRVQLLIDLANTDAERAGKTIRRLHEVENGERTLREIADTSFERHNLTMLDKLMSDLDLMLTVTAMTNGKDSETSRVALTSLLRRKGLVLEVVAARNATVRKTVNKNPQLAERVQQLTEIEAELASLERLPPSPTERDSHARRVSELIASADFRRTAIALYLPRGGGALEVVQQSNAITIEAVQAALPPDGALVEIVRYRPAQGTATNELSRWGEAHYAAFVLKHTGESVFCDLGDAASIENIVADFRQSLSQQEADVEKHGRKLDARIMAPLRPHLEGIQRLWISSDRALHTVPFEAFVDESKHYLVERFGITYVGTGRELTKPKSTNKNTNKPFILANPTFARSASAGKTSAESAEKTRSVDFRKVHFDPLPGTAAEAEGIHKALPNATVVTGEAATREALLTLVRPSILHIATHGFYLAQEKPKQESGTVRGLELDGANETGEVASADPLLRSGLALAGADGGAGIVSALELASMDLIGTKLAVLSACETGLGDLKNGEGVFGLRRALVIAGAEAQVVSLWQVDDEATRTMMVEYYTRLEAGGGRSEAMRATRMAMMRNPQTTHPFYWASFLVSGDSTALDGSDVPSKPVVLQKPPAVSAGARGCHCDVAGDFTQSNEMPWALTAILSPLLLLRGRFLAKKTAKNPPRKTIARGGNSSTYLAKR